MDRDEMSNHNRGLSIDASYQAFRGEESKKSANPTKVRFIWPNGFRGEECKKSTNQKQELPVVAMFVNGSGQNEQTL